jgi:hypothetical protein
MFIIESPVSIIVFCVRGVHRRGHLLQGYYDRADISIAGFKEIYEPAPAPHRNLIGAIP